MPQNWKTYKLKEVAKLSTGFAFKSKDYNESGILKVIRGKNITEGYLRWGDDSRFWNHSLQKLDKYQVKIDDIVIGMDGSKIGKNRAIVKKADLPSILAQRVGRIQFKDGITDQKFLWQHINNINFENYVDSVKTGTSIPHISLGQIGDLVINLPPLPEQTAIASILSTIDAKIENNLAINKTLEEMAMALYKEWFVDFGPFQDGKFVDSELGMIPEGWEVKRLDEVSDVKIGRTPPRKEPKWFSKSEGLKWISIKDIGNSGMYINRTSEYLTLDAIDKKRVPVIAENTVILSFKLTVGRVAITEERMLSNEAIAHFNLNHEFNIDTEYLYLYLKQFDYNTLGSTSSIATAVNSKTIKSIEIILPDYEDLEKFNFEIKPIFSSIRNILKQNQTLTTFRDTLLPKLISGEVRLNEFANT